MVAMYDEKYFEMKINECLQKIKQRKYVDGEMIMCPFALVFL